ncbi:MAG: hypothetical protein ACRCTI_13010, partial [Beijerinckiaceae bacterium]
MKGRMLKLSPGRRFIADLSWLARRIPQGVLRKTVSMANARDARAATGHQVPWTVIFAKAYALAARDVPDLRRNFAPLPWPHLYENASSVASIIVEREWQGETALLYAKVKQPEEKALADIAAELKLALTAPIESHKPFGSMRRTNRLPWPLRRLLWLAAFDLGPQRAKFFGTFGVTVMGHRGLSVNYPVSPVTSVLTLGPFRP